MCLPLCLSPPLSLYVLPVCPRLFQSTFLSVHLAAVASEPTFRNDAQKDKKPKQKLGSTDRVALHGGSKRRDGLCCVAYDEGAFMSEGSIIVLGGNNGAAMTNTCERAALVDLGGGNWGLEEWEELPKMFSRRGNFSAVHFKHEESNDHQIYAIGEIDAGGLCVRFEICDLVVRFLGIRPIVSQVLPCSSLKEAMHRWSSLAAGGYSDGKGGQRLTDSMERFDIAASQWVVEKSTGVARAGHAAALHNGRIMLGGGTDGLNALNSCEQFDPRYATDP